MLTGFPSEFLFFGLYFPPLFVAIMAGLVCATFVARQLNLSALSRYFWHPQLAYAALWLLATALISLFILAP
jgi:hypothetical protein